MEESEGMNAGAEAPQTTNDGAQAPEQITTTTQETPATAGSAPVEKPVSRTSIFSANAEGQTQSWVDGLPEELRGSAELRKFANVNEALKSYTNLVSLAGKKGLKAPAADAGEEAWEAYRAARRGGVETPEGYTAKYDREAMVGLDEDAFKTMSAYMFQNGFSDVEHTKAMELVAALREHEAEVWEAEDARRCAECERDLRDEWGANFDVNMNSVRVFVSKFPEAAKALQMYGLENDAAMCKMLLCAAERVSEASAPRASGDSESSPGDVEARLERLMKSKAFTDSDSAGHQMAQDQFFALMMEKAKLRAAGKI